MILSIEVESRSVFGRGLASNALPKSYILFAMPNPLESPPYIALSLFFLYFGIQTMWYLHSHYVCFKLSGVFIVCFLIFLNFRRFTDRETFNNSRNCQPLLVPQQSWGFTYD